MHFMCRMAWKNFCTVWSSEFCKTIIITNFSRFIFFVILISYFFCSQIIKRLNILSYHGYGPSYLLVSVFISKPISLLQEFLGELIGEFLSYSLWDCVLLQQIIISSINKFLLKLFACIFRHLQTKYSQYSFYEDSHFEISLIRTFIISGYPALGSSSERDLAHPKSTEQNLTRANENANKGCSFAVSQSVSETRGRTWASSPYAVLWCASCEQFCCMYYCNTFPQQNCWFLIYFGHFSVVRERNPQL
jgi:hypothetical protein